MRDNAVGVTIKASPLPVRFTTGAKPEKSDIPFPRETSMLQKPWWLAGELV